MYKRYDKNNNNKISNDNFDSSRNGMKNENIDIEDTDDGNDNGGCSMCFCSIVSPSFFICALPSYRTEFAYGTCYFYLNVFHTHAHMQI